ncbi:MAG: Thiol peroxidase, Bcp-type, partial [uncultured Quadrisphaera sp.]
ERPTRARPERPRLHPAHRRRGHLEPGRPPRAQRGRLLLPRGGHPRVHHRGVRLPRQPLLAAERRVRRRRHLPRPAGGAPVVQGRRGADVPAALRRRPHGPRRLRRLGREEHVREEERRRGPLDVRRRPRGLAAHGAVQRQGHRARQAAAGRARRRL